MCSGRYPISTFADWIDGWLRFEHAEGAAEVEAAYRSLLTNEADPATGHLCTLAAGDGA